MFRKRSGKKLSRKKKYCKGKRTMVHNNEKCERIRILRNSDFMIDRKLVELANTGSTSLESQAQLEPKSNLI